MEKNIKIYTSYHKKCELLKNKYIYPIQVGTALNGVLYPDSLHDDAGDNISDKNPMYCELTAQYWAWKNEDADYYGFMHYRRYFGLGTERLKEDDFGNVVYSRLNDHVIEELGLTEQNIASVVEQYDVISTEAQTVSGLGQGKTVWEHYKNAPHHRIEDMQRVLDIIAERYPDYLKAAQEYMNSSKAYYCNMYILREDIFCEYSQWLFDILKEHEERSDFTDYDIDEYRVSGFLAERLWGIYYTWLKENRKELRFKEVQRSFFENTEEQKVVTPVFAEHAVPIVLAANDKYVPYLNVTIQSIFENAQPGRNYDLIVLNSDISDENQKKLKKSYTAANFSVRFYNVVGWLENRNLKAQIHIPHITVETYYRLLMQDIMQGYDKVLYLDSDLVVLQDVAELYDTEIGDHYIGAVVDVDFAGCYKGSDPTRKPYYEKTLRMQSPYHYYNAGVLVMNLKAFREHFTTKAIFDAVESREWLYQDQDVLNVLCEGHVYYLGMEWNVVINWKDGVESRLQTLRMAPRQMYLDYLASRKNAKIVHYAGMQKPWNVADCDFAECFWKYAKNTASYEQILAGSGRRGVTADGTYQLQIPGADETIYVDGMYIKLINRLNKLFPKNSKRRSLMKKMAKVFFRK